MSSFLFLCVLLLRVTNSADLTFDITRLETPPGWEDPEIYGSVEKARSLALIDATSGIYVLVGAKGGGVHDVSVMIDEDKDGTVDMTRVAWHGTNTPNGIAVIEDTVYIAEMDKLWSCADAEAQLSSDTGLLTNCQVVYNLSTKTSHAWRYLEVNPNNGKLCITIGVTCNTCDRVDTHGKIICLDPDGTNVETMAIGKRMSVGMGFHPISGEFWFTDNGRDSWADDLPDDRLNRLSYKGEDFGFPDCHCTGEGPPEMRNPGSAVELIPDMSRASKGVTESTCAQYTNCVQAMGPHSASLGMAFVTDATTSLVSVLVARHGSHNRSQRLGYDVIGVELDTDNITPIRTYKFLTGCLKADANFRDGARRMCRPVDVLELPDGSVLVSDDYAHQVYRIKRSPASPPPTVDGDDELSNPCSEHTRKGDCITDPNCEFVVTPENERVCLKSPAACSNFNKDNCKKLLAEKRCFWNSSGDRCEDFNICRQHMKAKRKCQKQKDASNQKVCMLATYVANGGVVKECLEKIRLKDVINCREQPGDKCRKSREACDWNSVHKACVDKGAELLCSDYKKSGACRRAGCTYSKSRCK